MNLLAIQNVNHVVDQTLGSHACRIGSGGAWVSTSAQVEAILLLRRVPGCLGDGLRRGMASNKCPAGDRRSLPTFVSTFPRKPWSIEIVSLHVSKPISSARMQCRCRASGTGSAAPNISPEQSTFPSVTPDRRSCLSFCVSTALLFPAELYGMESNLRGGKYNLAGLSSYHRRERYTKVHAWCRLLPAFCLGRGNNHTSGEMIPNPWG